MHNKLVKFYRRRVTGAALALLTSISVLGALPAGAAEFREAAAPAASFSDTARISLETATELIRKKTGGRILSANPASKGSFAGYKVRVLVDQHKVQTWFVDNQGQVRGH